MRTSRKPREATPVIVERAEKQHGVKAAALCQRAAYGHGLQPSRGCGNERRLARQSVPTIPIQPLLVKTITYRTVTLQTKALGPVPTVASRFRPCHRAPKSVRLQPKRHRMPERLGSWTLLTRSHSRKETELNEGQVSYSRKFVISACATRRQCLILLREPFDQSCKRGRGAG